MKKCGKCKLAQQLNNFHNNRTKKDGKEHWCKNCKNPLDRKRNKRWRRSNPEKESARAEKSNLTRATRLKNAKGGRYDPGREDYKMRLLFFGGNCAYCRENKATTYDHGIPVSKGGSNFASNIYPCCSRCNLEKGAKILWKQYIPRCVRNKKDMGFNVAASLDGKYRVNIKSVW